MSIDDVRRRVAGLGSDVDGHDVVFVPSGSDPRRAPSHRWVVAQNGRGATMVGGSDRGELALHSTYADEEKAARAVHGLLGVQPAPQREDLDALRSRARYVEHLLLAAAGQSTAAQVEVGTPLDHIGNESGHYLYLLDTPMQARSVPPTDLNEPRTGYVVRRPLPMGTTVQLAPPWFGQPGGGVMVRLEHVIALYVENGYLERFAVRG